MEISRASAPPIGREPAPAPSAHPQNRPAQIAAAEAKPANPAADQAALDAIVEAANKLLALSNNSVRFSVDKSTEKYVVQLVDSQTNEVLRQYPTEQMLAIARDLSRPLGLLVSEQT